MAKFIYEDDKGQQTEFEFSIDLISLISALESQHNIDGLDEIFNTFKTSVKTQIKEDAHQALMSYQENDKHD